MKYLKEDQKRNARLDQLIQLMSITWDGDVLSKQARDELYKKELIDRFNGWNIINKKGIELLENAGYIKI